MPGDCVGCGRRRLGPGSGWKSKCGTPRLEERDVLRTGKKPCSLAFACTPPAPRRALGLLMRYPVMRLKSRGRGWGRAEPQFSASVWSSDSISQFKQAPPLNILTFLKYKLGGSEVMSICCINMLTSAWLVLLLWSLECKLENQQITQEERRERRDTYSTQSPLTS